MAPGARLAGGARALLGSALWLVSAGCDGELLNLGQSEGLTGGDAGSGASGGATAGTGGGAKTWIMQEQPVVPQMEDILLANPTLTRDLQQLFYTEQPRFGTDTSAGIRRATASGSAFSAGVELRFGELTAVDAASPAISDDGQELWLGLNLGTGLGGTDIWLSRGGGTTWSTPELVTELSSPFDDAPRPALAGLLMPISSKRHGGKFYQIYLASRPSLDAPWGEPTNVQLAAVNAADSQSADGFLAAEGRELYFASNRGGQSDLYVARRSDVTEAFGEPTLVPDLSSPYEERMPWLSPGEQHLYFASNRSGQYALYRAER
jgi:WD40-like Beta Propeller Repeat